MEIVIVNIEGSKRFMIKIALHTFSTPLVCGTHAPGVELSRQASDH